MGQGVRIKGKVSFVNERPCLLCSSGKNQMVPEAFEIYKKLIKIPLNIPLKKQNPFKNSILKGHYVGLLGLEPRMTGPKPVVLPITP